MDFSLSEEHGMLLEVVRGLLRKAQARRDGETYTLNGSKAWITGVDVADYILVPRSY